MSVVSLIATFQNVSLKGREVPIDDKDGSNVSQWRLQPIPENPLVKSSAVPTSTELLHLRRCGLT